MKMKKIFENKKKVILIAIIAILALGAFGTYQYNSYKEEQRVKQIEICKSKLTKYYEAFNKAETREDKLSKFKNIVKECKEYKNSKNCLKEVSNDYDSKIKIMKKYFVNEYQTEITKNTLEEIENIQDKAKFEESVKALNEISEMIKSETGIVLKKDEAKKYQEDIDALIKTYNKRVEEIKEAEKKAEEEKKKAEEERKAQETTAVNNNSSSSSYSGSYSNSYFGNSSSSQPSNSSSSNSGGNTSTPSQPWNYGYRRTEGWDYDENGNKINIHVLWISPNGDIYDDNGNFIGHRW
jgi:mid-cell-anchored protein Z